MSIAGDRFFSSVHRMAKFTVSVKCFEVNGVTSAENLEIEVRNGIS